MFQKNRPVNFFGSLPWDEYLHAPVTTHPEASLEQLDANDGKHEEEEDGDEEDVADVLHSHNDTLHHVLQTLCSVDRSAKRSNFLQVHKVQAKNTIQTGQGKKIVCFDMLWKLSKAPEGTENPENSENLDNGDRPRAGVRERDIIEGQEERWTIDIQIIQIRNTEF